MSPANIDSQQAELEREMEEAKRAAEQAEFAKSRAQSTLDPDGPHTAQTNPVAQFRQQLRLEEIRRAHTAAYASTFSFAPRAITKKRRLKALRRYRRTSVLPKQEESTPATKTGENQTPPKRLAILRRNLPS